MTVPTFLREFIYSGYAFEILQLRDADYDSTLISGYIGIGPYTSINKLDPFQQVQQTEVLVYQMRSQGVIDNQIVSFYLNKDPAKESFVKFGGYDKECFANGADDMFIL